MITAVVFDLDGVLIDSEPVWEQVRRQVVAEYGGHWAPDAQDRLMGMSTGEWSRYLSEDLGVGLPPEEVASLVIERMAERYRENLPLMPGAVEAVRALAGRWPLGLASSAPASLIDTVLDAASLRECFVTAMSTEQVAHGKPAPDIYLAVTGRLGQPPRECAAVEDSSNGLRSAAAAGCQVIAVPHPRYPPAPDALKAARLVLPSLTELTPDAVVALGDLQGVDSKGRGDRPRRGRSIMAVEQYSKQEVADMLRRAGLPQVADEAMRVLPDPVDIETLLRFAQPYGISREKLMSRMGGSP
jgi:HAD superfamily hydrolase (TIGR01509 family)